MRVEVLMLIAIAAPTLDLPSYCKGACHQKYMDGTYSQEKSRCACIDYEPVEIEKQIYMPHKTKRHPIPPMVYDGVDQMSYPAPEN